MNTEQRLKWLEERRTGIGGSDSAAVLGQSPWKSPYQVWLEKVGRDISDVDNEPMRWGRALEPVIRQQYIERTGVDVRVPENIMRHKEHDFVIASPDGITSDGKLLEIKTARMADNWGQPGTDEIPEPYIFQVQHYLAVTDLQIAEVVVLIGGQDFRTYTIRADKELQGLMIDGYKDFWDKVTLGIEPEANCAEDINLKYKFSREHRLEASEKIREDMDFISMRIKAIKELEESLEDAKAVVKSYMQENDTLIYGDRILATWKTTNPGTKFDVDNFKSTYPDLYKQFLKQTEPQRKFLIK